MKRYKVYVYNTVDKFWDCYYVNAIDPVDARNVAVQRLVDETCYTVEIGDDKVAANLLDHGTSGVAVNIIEKMLTAREILLGRHYLPGSIKHYELVEG